MIEAFHLGFVAIPPGPTARGGSAVQTRSGPGPRRYEQAEASLASGRGLPGRLSACPVEPQLREASVRNDRRFVGLDVHAWSVTGHALDASTGQILAAEADPGCRWSPGVGV